jgi:hypothetical protein
VAAPEGGRRKEADATSRQVEAGKMSEAEGRFLVDGFESTIRDYLHDLDDDASYAAPCGPVVRPRRTGRLSFW